MVALATTVNLPSRAGGLGADDVTAVAGCFECHGSVSSFSQSFSCTHTQTHRHTHTHTHTLTHSHTHTQTLCMLAVLKHLETISFKLDEMINKAYTLSEDLFVCDLKIGSLVATLPDV